MLYFRYNLCVINTCYGFYLCPMTSDKMLEHNFRTKSVSFQHVIKTLVADFIVSSLALSKIV